MASPVDAGRAVTNGTGATTTPVINLPASIVAGDLLVGILRNAAGGTHAWNNGFTTVGPDSSDASDDSTSFGYKLADGSEGATITGAFGTSGKFAAMVWRITGAANPATQAPEFSVVATGSSTAPDPGTVTPTGGSKDYLFLWAGGWEGEQTSPPAGNPTNYSNPNGGNSGTAGVVATNCRVAGASRQLTAASENPGSWTISVTDDWSAWTVAVHPAPPTTTVLALSADGTVLALIPAPALQAPVPSADATASGPIPTVSAGSVTTIAAPASSGDASAPIPVATLALGAVAAAAQASAETPGLALAAGSPSADASASALAPIIDTGAPPSPTPPASRVTMSGI